MEKKKLIAALLSLSMVFGTAGNTFIGASAESDDSDPWSWCGTTYDDSSDHDDSVDSYHDVDSDPWYWCGTDSNRYSSSPDSVDSYHDVESDPWYWCGTDSNSSSLPDSYNDTDSDDSDTSSVPEVEEYVNEAPSAETENITFDASTGVLTLKGNITKAQVLEYSDKTNVKSIVAAEGCVFPEDCSNMFGSGKDNIINFPKIRSIDISKADTSKVKNMSGMFAFCAQPNTYSDLKTINVSGIDTSNVTDMNNMFRGIAHVESLDVSSFDTSKVTDMSWMFYACWDVKELDVSNFDTSNVTNMMCMFAVDNVLESIDLSKFDTSKVTNMSNMFAMCPKLKELDLSSFDTSAVAASDDDDFRSGFVGMFSYCYDLETIYASEDFVVNDGVNTVNMFVSNNKDLHVIGGNGTKWSKDHVKGDYACIDKEGQPGYFTLKGTSKKSDKPETDGSVTFDEATGVLTLSGHITKDQVAAYSANKNVTSIVAAPGCVFPEDCSWMFGNAFRADYRYFENIHSIDISKADTSHVKNMHGMFGFNACGSEQYKDFTVLNVSNIDTSNVTDMSRMFFGCGHVKVIDVADFDTSNVTDMSMMFSTCWDVEFIDVRDFDTSKVTDMTGMFSICHKLTTIDVTTFDTSNVRSMAYMFGGSESLETLDLSSFDLSALSGPKADETLYGAKNMFVDCATLKTVYVSDNWKIPEGVATNDMFGVNSGAYPYAKSLPITGGNGTVWSKDHINGEYARADKEGQPGYFTYKAFTEKPETGNLNRDSKIDVEDAVMVISQVNGTTPLRKYSTKYADVDGSGKVDIEDAVSIISHVNGVKPIK